MYEIFQKKTRRLHQGRPQALTARARPGSRVLTIRRARAPAGCESVAPRALPSASAVSRAASSATAAVARRADVAQEPPHHLAATPLRPATDHPAVAPDRRPDVAGASRTAVRGRRRRDTRPRPNQPIGVASSAGSSAIHGPRRRHDIDVVGQQQSRAPVEIDRPRCRSRRASAARHRGSSPSTTRRRRRCAGPNRDSHARSSAARAVAVGIRGRPSGSQRSIGDHTYRLEVHPPEGRPRTIRPSAASRVSTRVVMATCPPYALPSA